MQKKSRSKGANRKSNIKTSRAEPKPEPKSGWLVGVNEGEGVPPKGENQKSKESLICRSISLACSETRFKEEGDLLPA